MSFIQLIKSRKSVRQYQEKPIEKEILMQVLEAGRLAPSACNLQPWHYHVIQSDEMRNKLSTCYARDWIKTAPVIIAICGDHQQSWKRTRTDQKDHLDIDIAITVDHMTLAAAELGLGSCWICAFDEKKCAEVLNLPDHIEPIVLLPLGYPTDTSDATRETPRKSMSDITTWDT